MNSSVLDTILGTYYKSGASETNTKRIKRKEMTRANAVYNFNSMAFTIFVYPRLSEEEIAECEKTRKSKRLHLKTCFGIFHKKPRTARLPRISQKTEASVVIDMINFMKEQKVQKISPEQVETGMQTQFGDAVTFYDLQSKRESSETEEMLSDSDYSEYHKIDMDQLTKELELHYGEELSVPESEADAALETYELNEFSEWIRGDAKLDSFVKFIKDRSEDANFAELIVEKMHDIARKWKEHTPAELDM